MILENKTVRLSGARGMIAGKMVESLQSAARFTHHGAADATALLAENVGLAEAGTKVSVEDLLMLCVIGAIRRNPDANGLVEGKEIKLSAAIYLCVAIALPGNLLAVPAIFGAQDMGVEELRAARQDLSVRAKTNKLSVKEMTGGSFTISNLGLSRVEQFPPIINAPQIAILGVGRSVERAVKAEDGSVEFRPFIGLSLAFDHRAIDGAPAADTLTAICEEIEGLGK